MNLRKTAALLLSLIMCFSLIVPVGSFAEETVTAADNAKRSENLLAFAGRLHNMTEKYSAEYTKKAADTDPYANGRIIVKSAEELDYTGSVAHVNGYNDWHIIQYRTSEEARKAAEAFELVKGVQYAEPDNWFRLPNRICVLLDAYVLLFHLLVFQFVVCRHEQLRLLSGLLR